MPKKRERRDPKPLLLENQTHKRRDRAQELRSARRQGILAKRRKCDAHSAGGVVNSAGGLQQDPWSGERLAAAIQGVKDSPVAQILPHLTELRKLLSLEYSPVEEVVERAGLAPRLIDLLGAPNDEIQIEATWCLTNIASSWTRHTEKILPAAPQLISFLSAPNPALQEQALWALGNIAGDGSNFRELLHANGALLPIFRLLQQPPSIEIARTAAWAISNLARGERTPGTPFLEVGPAIVAALQGSITSGAPRDDPLRVEAAWVLAFLTAKENGTVSEFVRAGVVPALVRALVDSGGQDPLCTPALRALGNLVSGQEDWANSVMVHAEFLPCLDAILKSQDKSQRALVKEAAWVASNVAAGGQEHRDAFVAQGSPVALTALLVSDQLDLQQEAMYGVWNLVAHDQKLLVQAAKTTEVMNAYVALVRTQSPAVVRCALSFLQLVCQNVPGGPRMVEANGGVEAIDDVHYCGRTEPELQEAAGLIMNKFYGSDYENESDEELEDGDGEVSFWDNRPGSEGESAQMKQASAQQQQHQQQGLQQQHQQPPLAPLGRGVHLTRPAWMP